MAITYGALSTGGSNSFKVGWEFSGWSSVNSGSSTATGTISFYVYNTFAVSGDVQTFNYVFNNVTVSGPTTNTPTVTASAGTATLISTRNVSYTYSTWGSVPTVFSGSMQGLGSGSGSGGFYTGGPCSVTWSFDVPARPGGVPTAPSSIASYPDDGYVTIVYGNSSPTPDPAASYQYSGDDGASGWNNITTNPFNVVAPNGTPITIYVKAVNVVGSSASVSATSTPRTVPGAPASVTLTPGNGSVSVAYTAPSSNGGNAISSYEYSTNGSTYTTTPSNPFTVSGTNGTSITVYVRARNDAGAGSATSNSATPRTVPSAPQSFAGSNTTFGQLSLSWAAPSSNGGNAVSSYVLRTGSTVLQNTSATSYVHTGLSPYTDYSYTVTAANAAGESTTASLTVKTMGGVAKVWNGTAWVTILPKVWNGTAWVEAQARMWNGTSWVHGI